jgi:hypothetical protein
VVGVNVVLRCQESCGVEAARLRCVLVRIAEAIQDGAIDEAHAFALAGAEAPIVDRFVCIHCGNAYEWPGQLDDHLRLSASSQPPSRTGAA